jgi:hypothetical protein
MKEPHDFPILLEAHSRSATANKHPPRRAVRASAFEVAGQRLADLCDEGHLRRALTFTVKRQLACSPIDIIERQTDHFAGAQTQSRQQQ